MNKIEYIADYSDTRLKSKKTTFLRLRKKYSFSEGLIPKFRLQSSRFKHLGINKHGFDPYKSEGFIPNLKQNST